MKPVLVVEGTSDINRLRPFIDCEFVSTNGSEISRETILYIKELSEKRDIYVLTDPDFPGQKIRAKIEEEVPNCHHLFVRKEHAIKGKKLGVCECDDEEIKRVLSFIDQKKNNETLGNLTQEDLLNLDLTYGNNAKQRRMFLMECFPIGFCNAKTILKRLNSLGITKEDLQKALEDYHDC